MSEFINTTLEYTGERMIPEKAEHSTFWEHIYRYKFATHYVRGKRVLDIACGEGYGSAALGRSGAKSVIGVDISEKACLYAKEKYGIETYVGNACQIPLKDNSVDIVISFETIEHIENPLQFIAECFRVLTNNGQILISTPNKETYLAGQAVNPFHCSEMTEEEFAALLDKYFHDLRFFTQCPTQFSWWSIRNMAVGNSQWCKIRGVGRLYRHLQKKYCSHLEDKYTEKYRQAPILAITRSETRISLLFNPFSVRPKKWGNVEKPLYLVALGTKK